MLLKEKKRGTKKDYAHFLRIANGSSAELETQLLIAQHLYPKISTQTSISLVIEIQKMLTTMIKKLEL
jgi:four helix bundle protein